MYLLSKSSYLRSIMDKTENFIEIIRWKAHFCNNLMMRDNDNYTNSGMEINMSP